MENFQFRPEWDIVSIISEELNLSSDAVRNTVDMLEAEQTIPFIARYRKEKTANMEVAQLREVFRLLEELKIVIQKAEYVAKQVHAKGKLTPNLLRDLQRATTVCEIEQVFAPFKPASKKTLAERAKQSGLEPLALQFMKGTKLNFQKYIDPNVQGKETLENLKSGIKHIVAESISKDQETLCELRKMPIMGDTVFEVTPAKNPIKGSADTPRSKAKAISHEATSENYESYFNKKTYHMRDIQSFHVLAINRAETQKVMNVKVIFPEWVVRNFMKYLHRRWIPPAVSSEDYKFWEMILQDCYTRFLAPRLIREIRSDLTKKAEKASLDVFGENLKHLLMTPPVLGCTIMGIDPGFSHGCKIAIISETSEILQTGIVYLNLRKVCENKLIGYLKTHRCSTIAIGNGTACRETEVFVSDIVKKPEIAHLNCRYCIVNENGASIYSVSDLAQEEMPDLDPNIRSAVSIARRLQNPLAELVKIDPKHLGIGMYQHDLQKVPLKKKLDGVVEDCVSFVGVDINSCSPELLQYVAGVGPAMAKKIIKHRTMKGNFQNRMELQEVKGLGPKTFLQCAGFIRVNATSGYNTEVETDVAGSSAQVTVKQEEPVVTVKQEQEGFAIKKEDEPKSKKRKAETSTKGKKKLKKTYLPNPLDKTWIHPESYEVTERLLKLAGALKSPIGSEAMREKVSAIVSSIGLETLAQNLEVGPHTLQVIIDGLKNPSNFDVRSDFSKPLFKRGLVSVNDLRVGTKLTGEVVNVVEFGAFVDIGVSHDALIHSSRMRNMKVIRGNKVEVAIVSINRAKSSSGKIRISLALNRVI